MSEWQQEDETENKHARAFTIWKTQICVSITQIYKIHALKLYTVQEKLIVQSNSLI